MNIEQQAAFDLERAAYLGRSIDALFSYVDPGMRVRRDLINANLPIDEAGNAIPEKIDEL